MGAPRERWPLSHGLIWGGARAAWLLLVLAALVVFALGLRAFAQDRLAFYQTNFGLEYWTSSDGQLALRPERGGQAMAAGILEGDRLVAIDGGAPTLETLEQGRTGDKVILSVRTGDRPPRQATVVRGGEIGATLVSLGLSANLAIGYLAAVEILAAVAFTAVAAFLFWQRSTDVAALLVSLTLVAVFVGTSAQPAFELLLGLPARWEPLADFWLSLAVILFLLAIYLFPSGRFVPRWMMAGAFLAAIWLVAAWFYPQLYFWRREEGGQAALIVLAIGATGLLAQAYRYRFVSGAVERQQTKWAVLGISAAILFGLSGQFGLAEWLSVPLFVDHFLILPLARLLQLLLPVALAFAILRRGLWDVDLIINRGLVYGGLTALVVSLYVLIVGLLGALFQVQGNLFVSLLATAVIAVVFQPARERLQRGVNRLMYGQRDDPVGMFNRLARSLESAGEPEAILPNLVMTVARALKLPYVAVLVREPADRFEPAAEWGNESARSWDGNESIPLLYQNDEIGRLVVAPRSAGEKFSSADRRLLSTIALLAATTVQADQLNQQLRRSRHKLVATREEERRRIRRDLHDGLGPALASLTLQADTAHDLVRADPAVAELMLEEMTQQAQEAVEDVRRLIYGLRPPALDELGLSGALRQHAASLSAGGLQTRVEAPDGRLELPAAVEVAAFRIAQEATNNAVRHSGAANCTISLRLDGALSLEIVDDGRGLPEDPRAGVGLNSMRERAAELGGSCSVENRPEGGVAVKVTLPLNEEPS